MRYLCVDSLWLVCCSERLSKCSNTSLKGEFLVIIGKAFGRCVSGINNQVYNYTPEMKRAGAWTVTCWSRAATEEVLDESAVFLLSCEFSGQRNGAADHGSAPNYSSPTLHVCVSELYFSPNRDFFLHDIYYLALIPDEWPSEDFSIIKKVCVKMSVFLKYLFIN